MIALHYYLYTHHFLKQPSDRFLNLQLPFGSYLYVLPYIHSINRRTCYIPGPLLGGQKSTARHPIWDKEVHSLPMKTCTVNIEIQPPNWKSHSKRMGKWWSRSSPISKSESLNLPWLLLDDHFLFALGALSSTLLDFSTLNYLLSSLIPISLKNEQQEHFMVSGILCSFLIGGNWLR